MNANRRELIAGALGMFASSALPSVASENVGAGAFAKRGPHERLTLSYAHVKVAAERPFSVMHISDTHLTAAGLHEGVSRSGVAAERTTLFGGRQEDALRDSLEWAKLNADYVLHTGDVVDFQSEANFALVRKHFGPAVFGIMGNHEFYTYLEDEVHTWKEPFKQRSWERLKDVFAFDPRFSAKVVHGVNFVCMDDVFGTFQPDQVERFRLEAAKGLPIVLCLHVPILTPEIWRLTRRYWHGCNTRYASDALPAADDLMRQQEDKTTRDFISYLKGERRLKCILSGHLHFMAEEPFSPTASQYVVAGNYLFAGREILFDSSGAAKDSQHGFTREGKM